VDAALDLAGALCRPAGQIGDHRRWAKFGIVARQVAAHASPLIRADGALTSTSLDALHGDLGVVAPDRRGSAAAHNRAETQELMRDPARTCRAAGHWPDAPGWAG